MFRASNERTCISQTAVLSSQTNPARARSSEALVVARSHYGTQTAITIIGVPIIRGVNFTEKLIACMSLFSMDRGGTSLTKRL